MTKMKLGYARVSTLHQDEALQHDALHHAGCDQIFVDKTSGKLTSRPALDDLLAQARAGSDVPFDISSRSWLTSSSAKWHF